ncbi:[protein-PII] uridylyltransferase family protein [Thalassoroseus pseudoceratinae]|uniref:[protein-PII] uridylyltransferase family protein n=1 Tax=Thalassoroseus pseudoceratinae TaxID=2713176 RepID=UPI0014232213|nr:glutamine synthetase adenylyltransferase [Thalassoroseus pseudoceratinae]
MFTKAHLLLTPGSLDDAEALELLSNVSFADAEQALKRIQGLPTSPTSRDALAASLPALLIALSDAVMPDGSLVNFERFVRSVADQPDILECLASNPRAVEILVKLFVGSQFLTEILLRNPEYLQQLTQHRRLADMKSRDQFLEEANSQIASLPTVKEKLDGLRRFQHWELLRIGACDSFGLFDLKSATIQLSLLADAIVQCCLSLFADQAGIALDEFVVIAFGKLGGEELNYSSDIDLVFLSSDDATKYWQLGQKLIQALSETTGEGFLYRVDMRLRPWGRSGALVNTIESHWQYLKRDGRQWEKQALLKARPVAGNLQLGAKFVKQTRSLILATSIDSVRSQIREMKVRIEDGLKKQGREWGEVKSGTGSIRDVEFTTQFLQLAHGAKYPQVLSFNTLDGIARLADAGLIQANEYRLLSTGYTFLRTVEHALQLLHYKQTHTLPSDERGRAWLARRLDYPNSQEFLHHYERQCASIRRIFEKYIDQIDETTSETVADSERLPDHLAHMDRSYTNTFSELAIVRHAVLMRRLSSDNVVEVDSNEETPSRWLVTIIGYDLPGDLSLICGLMFVYGFDIESGHVFTEEQMPDRQMLDGERGWEAGHSGETLHRKFVNVFRVRPPEKTPLDLWTRYRNELAEMMLEVREGGSSKAQGRLAKRVASVFKTSSEPASALLPVQIEIDADSSDQHTVLHIRGEDTPGFLYELSNALTTAGIDMSRVIVSSVGHQVFDTLYVTDTNGLKVTDPVRIQELRTTVVLIKHFTHLLPRSPNPEAALVHFRAFLDEARQRDNWLEELGSLHQPKVLNAFAKVMGASDFLWEDFLRVQHENLFPIIRDVESLARRKRPEELRSELDELLQNVTDRRVKRKVLNDFKDREMFRIDMRHILGHISEFGEFSEELSVLAELVVQNAYRICDSELREKYGTPRLPNGEECGLCIAALGKFGGRELGYASDIELMFLYEGEGRTDRTDNSISVSDYYVELAGAFRKAITARQEGSFQIDLRLRPYGRAGRLAVPREMFETYFGPDGDAWPYERQSLVRFRPIAGDADFGAELVALRDSIIYTGSAFDRAAMRAMRERQVMQLVKADTVHAKLSHGGLVDCEYLVQGLQMTYSKNNPSLHTPNTLQAMESLHELGYLSSIDYEELRDAYIFLRRLIDALRVVRGNAKDLTVPSTDSEEFIFLSRRLGYGNDPTRLQTTIERALECVSEMSGLLDRPNQSPAY